MTRRREAALVPKVVFTQDLQVHTEVPPSKVVGGTVREVLDAVFAVHQRARG